MPDDRDFLEMLLATFRLEAEEHLDGMTAGLLELEKMPEGGQEIIERVYREAHSLKGAARAVNLGEIESLCHTLESVFAAMKAQRLAATPQLFDELQPALTVLSGLLAGSGPPAPAGLLHRLEVLAKAEAVEAPVVDTGEAESAPPPAEAEPTPVPSEELPELVTSEAEPAPAAIAESRASVATEAQGSSVSPESTIRIATAKIDAVMREAEELFGPRLSAAQRGLELSETQDMLAGWKKRRAGIQPVLRSLERSLGRQGRRDEELERLLEYLEAENLSLKTLDERLAKMETSSSRDRRALSGIVDNLLAEVKDMHMLPFSSLLRGLPRVVRDLAHDRGKRVELTITGGEIEVDRRILEGIKDPLNHLVRNGVDHGIEKPAERAALGKPEAGTLTISVTPKEGSKVEILVADDGAGIGLERVKATAVRLGHIAAENLDSLSEAEALALIFRSGLSTSAMVTDISGRGLGLAIVREKIDALAGSIAIETAPGKGSRFLMTLPLTLATFRGVLVRVAEQNFIVPAVHVERATRVAAQSVKTLENRETIAVDGQAVALVDLADILGLTRRAGGDEQQSLSVLVLALGRDRIAFRVDRVQGEQEVLVKGLGPQLARVRNLAGASVLGTGEVVAVLNVADLMKSAVKAEPSRPTPSAEARPERATQTILVAEDSITSRTLLKNILESAGYSVSTAVDGMEAYTTLKSGSFDLLVSDVEMPRMDGFDLTARVRADKKLTELPVVLVTALASREHRERGIDVGANAYIVKSSFDQSNLLEVIARLI